MADKGTKKAKKPAKRTAKPAKRPAKPAKPAKPEIKPGFGAYALAVWQLAWGWLKSHKAKVLIGLIVLAAVVGGLSAWAGSGAPALSNDDIVIRVSRELGITGDGNPAVLTVEDETKVSQPFLEEAKNGDKVLLYYKSGRSVLYRPAEDRIIRSGTYTPPDAKVFIRSGTTDDSKTPAAKGKLDGLSGIELVSQDASTKRDYQRTIVVSVTDRYPEQADAVAKALGAELSRLPRGETIPDADILVIVGAE